MDYIATCCTVLLREAYVIVHQWILAHALMTRMVFPAPIVAEDVITLVEKQNIMTLVAL